MNKLVYTVFKTIAMSIIFIFVFDILFYMYRVTALNARMESFSTSLKKVVMENNYLPSEMSKTYQNIFGHMICDFNSVEYRDGMSGDDFLNGDRTGGNNVDGRNNNSVNAAAFISGFHWNYDTDAVGTNLSINADRQAWNGSSWETRTTNIVKTKMNTPADYGDIMVVQMRVGVFQPIWGWTQARGGYHYNGEDVQSWVRSASTTELIYTYYVPCLNFRTVTNS